MEKFLISCVIFAIGLNLTKGQFFSPELEDSEFLRTIRTDLKSQKDASKSELVDEAKLIKNLTKKFIGAQLRENLFEELSSYAEEELRLKKLKDLELLAAGQVGRQGRQEEEEEEEDAEEAEEKEEPKVTSTTPKAVIPQVADLLSVIFGAGQGLTGIANGAVAGGAKVKARSISPLSSHRFDAAIEFLSRTQPKTSSNDDEQDDVKKDDLNDKFLRLVGLGPLVEAFNENKTPLKRDLFGGARDALQLNRLLTQFITAQSRDI